MSKERELLQRIVDYADEYLEIDMEFIPEIQELLAQPKQQPEAWIIVNKETGYRTQVSDLTPFLYHREIFEVIPLYTSPPNHEQDSITDATLMAYMPNGSAVSNVYEAYEEGRKSVMFEQEPVAWCQMVEGKVQDLLTSFEMKDWLYDKSWIPLYLAPPKREPLINIYVLNAFKADDEATHPYSYWAGVEFAEKHHGIGGEE